MGEIARSYTLSMEEKSLLMYLETRVVDHGGVVDMRHVNKDDVAIIDRWTRDGFVASGRIASSRTDDGEVVIGTREGSTWCRFSDDAMSLAHALRRERATRMWANRRWETTDEKLKRKD